MENVMFFPHELIGQNVPCSACKPVKNSVHMEPKESNSKPGIPQLTAGTPGYHQPSGEASQGVGWNRGKIRLIEGKAKCRHLKKLTWKGTLRQLFICLRPRIPYSPPLPNCIRVYTVYLFTQGRG